MEMSASSTTPQANARKPRAMVARKYLCAAPHPSKWDDHAEALLKSLGGNQEKRDQVIQQTLTTLEEMHAAIRKTGPGRKSNAEHAVAFYLHVLELNKEKSEEYSEDRTDRRPDKRTRVARVPLTSNNTNAERDTTEDSEKDNSSECADDGGGNEKKAAPSDASMDSKEFLDQHNDQCEVCNLGGQLLCCSTCNLVFHLECVRPSLKELPKYSWSCAYCIASGAVGCTRDSKARRKARAAVLAMARLSPRKRKQLLTAQNDPKVESDEEEELQESETVTSEGKVTAKESASSELDGRASRATTDQSTFQEGTEEKPEAETEIHGTKSQSNCDSSKESTGELKTPVKRKLDLYKITDAFSPKMTPESVSETRARRPRRQPTLYDPQNGPARKWQSDVTLNWKLKTTCNNDAEEGWTSADNEQKRGDETEGDEGRDDEMKMEASARKVGDVWCTFCKDDTSVTICCFCACRVCFGKHDASKLLLCDNCDDEYHTFCLRPPLDAVPTSRRWFCPSCDPAEKKAKPFVPGGTRSSTKTLSTSSKQSSDTPYGTRSSSTPKKAPPPPIPPPPPAKIEGIIVKRKVGRPRKSEVVVPVPEPLPVRKRGRPPKLPSTTAEEEERKPRKRGRPPKSESEKKIQLTPKPVRKRGRPPKSRSALIASKAVTLSDGSNRPSKRLKICQVETPTAAHVATPTRSNCKATQVSRVVPGSGSSLALSNSGRRDVISPIASRANMGNVPLPGYFDDNSREALSVTLIPRPTTFSDGNQSGENAEYIAQTMSSNSSQTGQSGAVSPTKTQKSRSGRTVKRSSFHDEIEEGEQHLRSQRYAIEMQRKAEAAAAATNSVAVLTAADEQEIGDGPIKASDICTSDQKPAALTMSSIPTVAGDSIDCGDSETTEEAAVITDGVAIVATPCAEKPESTLNQQSVTEVPTSTTTAKLPPPELGTEQAVLPFSVDVANSQSSQGESAAALSVAASSAARGPSKVPRRKPGARECMQISRRFGAKVIPQKYMDILMDYCTRGKVEHLIRMRERLDSHSRFLESQLAGLEALVKEKGEIDVVVPAMPGSDKEDKLHQAASSSDF